MLLENLARCRDSFAGYTELRAHENTTQTIQILMGSVTTNQLVRVGGVSARVRRGGMWGFASRPVFSSEAVKNVLDAATQNAAFLESRRPAADALPARPGNVSVDLRSGRAQPGAAELLELLRPLDEYIRQKYPKLQSRWLRLHRFDNEKSLVTSDGAESMVYLPQTHIYFGMTMERDDGPVELMSRRNGGLGNAADLYASPDALLREIDALYEDLCRKREGVYPEAGLRDCILGPDLAGILAHEAVGHTVEADLVQAGSVAGRMLGTRVADERISIVDFAHTAWGETAPVPVYVDDEGVEARDAVLIENGVLKGFMHNKESAQRAGVEPDGNARGFTFSDEPLIRMRNTAILPGQDKLEDMVASLEDGYYLCNPSNGQADMTGEFMFGVTMGYEVKNGKRGRALLDTTVSGVAFDMLKTVTQVSDDVTWLSSGFCGKKQPMRVGMGGPAIRCKINVGGR